VRYKILLLRYNTNNKIKLVCRAFYENVSVRCIVKPVEATKEDMYTTAYSTTSIISIKTDLMGKISIIEHKPEIEQAYVDIFRDTISLIKGIELGKQEQ